MSIKTDGLAETLKYEVEKVLGQPGVRECIENNKIVITVSPDLVKTKVVEPIVRKKVPSRLEPDLQEKIKEARKVLKGNRHAMYLFTLLVSLKSELKKTKITSLDEQAKEQFIPMLSDLTKLLTGVSYESNE